MIPTGRYLIGTLALIFLVNYGRCQVIPPTPDADWEYYMITMAIPVQGTPLYARPLYVSAGQLLKNYLPSVVPLHIFKITGEPRILAIVKTTTPGALCDIALGVTNFGMEIETIPLYSFEAFSTFLGVQRDLTFTPLRALPCARVYMFETSVESPGGLEEYTEVMRNYTTEVLRLRSAGIIMDAYKMLSVTPNRFVIFSCGTPSFFDQMMMSVSSLNSDYGLYSVERAVSLVTWDPYNGKDALCYVDNFKQAYFGLGKK
ncbi:hypothetical protein LOTGIDRAFT_229070 [Lottia gigantea]|uniref:Receptor ligand binding region domain-containing protein n=1 Tax=Lottia gigantea TaxID=225164 RepID=V3ZDH4_LOTGI|nr:hypothetical protein LOTGIDRAFT_229070 [Lottia gigantea]ESO89168.1 hypothetical protein LOTGIDRAFT_229070 [Lottia gigantea]